MKKITQLALLFALAFGAISQAKAELLIEPVLGYSLNGKLELGDASYSGARGASYGGRLGYQKLGFQIGGDYLHSSLNMNDDDFKEDMSLSEWGGFVGFEFPILFRVYAGYIFSATGTSEVETGDFELSSGSGMKVGLGFTGLPFIDINFEYRSGKFEKSKTDGVSGDDDEDIKYSAFMVALSLPLTF